MNVNNILPKCKFVLTTTERFTILEDVFRYGFSIVDIFEARFQRRMDYELNVQQQTRSSFFLMFFP